MSSDPGWTTGSTTKFACRASYTILTTDGFWNGQNPTTPAGVIGAANKDGPVYTPPTGKVYTTTQYKAVAPFSGGGVSSSVASLADVATYYWETDLSTMPDEVAPSTPDPAFWQHMTTFTMGLGFTPPTGTYKDSNGNITNGIMPAGTTIQQILAWAQGGPAISNFSWPTPSSNSLNNIADLAHAAVNGHGDFFSVKNPQDLAAGFARAIAAINARNVEPTPSAVNASVLTAGALTFATGYNTGDWSGSFKVVELNADGSPGPSVWPTDPDTLLNTNFHGAGYTARKVYSAAYNSTTDTLSKFQFNAAAAPTTTGGTTAFDAIELAGLQSPALGGGNDTTANRINYLLGDNEFEGAPFRSRSSGILGAIINASPVYVSGAASNYNGNWPSGSVELTATQSYDDFVNQQASVPGMAYIAANDGMLHAFNAPAPKCNTYAADGSGCTSWDYGTNPGKEAWAFVPRAVYANLGNLTSATDFNYRPTVDSTPVSRDVFFGESGATNTDNKWHTILTGGVGLGGRGVYALDITNPSTFTQSNVLWEFDSDMKVSSSCVSIVGSSVSGTCAATDLGYTVAQPNVGRLADGTWAVVVPNGYFPDCSTPDYPTANVTACNAIAAQAPKYSNGHPYSALFVLDAQTGSMIAELKTPDLTGVTSYGLATPVMGNLSNNNVDNVAYAGDVEGNLWKFTLGGTGPSAWTVSLVYQAATQGAQPITSMPRLFPDPVSNGFMVVFGTGKFLGVGDNSNSTVQSIYGVRDGDPSTATATGNAVILGGSGKKGLTQNYLHEFVAPDTIPNPNGTGTIPNPHAGETLRCITGGASDPCEADASAGTKPTTVADSSASGGWYVNLDVEVAGKQANAGERVVVNPGAIFASSTVVFESLITGAASSDPCSPTTTGAVMALNAVTGAPAGVSSLGGWPIVGGRINNARTSGSLPIVSALGGGQAYLPGTGLAPTGTTPFSVDAPIWRRRSWSEINPNQ
jgi:type IV pilus assembly protein PilY1